jgi:hypothetical protein
LVSSVLSASININIFYVAGLGVLINEPCCIAAASARQYKIPQIEKKTIEFLN